MKAKGNDSIINYIGRAVIISLSVAVAVMIRPCTAKAETTKGDFTITEGEDNCSFDSGLLKITGDCTVKNDPSEFITDNHIEITRGCTVTLAGVNIEPASAAPILISISNGNTVTLKLSGTNTLDCTPNTYACIEKNGDNSGSLIITSEDDGVLNAIGGNYGAVIGGGYNANGSNITISGGTVNATAGTDGAGIGGGYDGNGSNITISGGTVTAMGDSGAGIGGGKSKSGSKITISGGTVTATSQTGAGIGGGYNANGSNITISGGKVKASSENGSAIGKGYSGSGSSDNSITPSSTNSVNVWKDTENESDAKAYSDYTSSIDISTWINSKLMIIFDKINVTSSNSLSGSSSSYHASCSHHYEWTVEREPTETQEGELVYKCSLCGDISARQPISSYEYYLYKCMGRIHDAKAGDTVTFSSKCWNSYPKAFFEKLAERRDITVKIQFTYKHKDYEMTIAPSQTVDTSSDYYGPLKLIELYGASEVSKQAKSAKNS